MPQKHETVARKKIEIQAKGVRIPEELVDEMENKYNFPGVRFGWMIFCFKAPDGELLHTFVAGGKFSQESPFHLVKKESRFEIWNNGERYVELEMTPRPKYYDLSTSDGTPMVTVATLGSPTHMNVVKSMYCLWAEKEKECTFCAYRQAWAQVGDKTPLQIAETVQAAVDEGIVEHVSITTGTLPTKDRGIRSISETARAITARMDIPIKCSFEPVADLSYLEEAKESGIDVVSINIECFDPEVRKVVLPNAKGRTPLETYIKNWKKCVDLWGRNQVFSVIPAGLGDDEETTLRGAEMLASYGVIPWLEPFHPLPGAPWEDRKPMDPEKIIRLYEGVLSIMDRYDLDLSVTKAGCVKVGVYGAVKEVQKYGV
ncbi:MAG: radical SAM protein [Dehalococcoidia bacterium]|nr:radical SAM protein [Dehalococcoidia bacterium]